MNEDKDIGYYCHRVYWTGSAFELEGETTSKVKVESMSVAKVSMLERSKHVQDDDIS